MHFSIPLAPHFCRIKLTAQLDIAKYTKDGAKMKELYNTIEKLDAYYKVVLGRWTVKQIAVEKKHQRCLEKMIAAFAQVNSQLGCQGSGSVFEPIFKDAP